MYISSIRLKNIRSFAELSWIPHRDAGAGWHVIIGDNGSGKSTFLRAVALALVGRDEALALRQNWNSWLRRGTDRGSIHLRIMSDKHADKFSESLTEGQVEVVQRENSLFLPISFKRSETDEEIVSLGNGNDRGSQARQSFYREEGKGWFSASYGPFRRFTGGEEGYETIFHSNPSLARHLSVFGESIALTECLRWLQDLRFKQLEKEPEGDLLDSITRFVNQADFLPHQTQLQEVTSRGVTFVDGNGCVVPIEDLSDGYRSVLSLTFELIRQLARTYGPDKIFDKADPTKIVVPGVVLIDEVDAHLHPTWQRRVGVWFREHFPRIQFIVTTHSPLVCQAATVGTVYRLPRPGSEEQGAFVTGIELGRLLYGNVLDAYGTKLFGTDVTRSEEGKKQLNRLAELNLREMRGRLSQREQEEQRRLRDSLPTAAYTLKQAEG